MPNIQILGKVCQRQLGLQLLSVQTERGGEFMSNQYSGWLKANGIKHRVANVCVPQENGIAECRGGVLQTMVHAMLGDTELPMTYTGQRL